MGVLSIRLTCVHVFVIALLLLGCSSATRSSNPTPQPTDEPQPTDKPSAVPKLPLATTIDLGDAGLAVVMNSPNGEAVLPAFKTIAAYDRFYKYDDVAGGDKPSCDPDTCFRPVYEQMKAAGQIEALPVGAHVTILQIMDDPQAQGYQICRIRVSGRERLVDCDNLAFRKP